jgi:hypothetical protein
VQLNVKKRSESVLTSALDKDYIATQQGLTLAEDNKNATSAAAQGRGGAVKGRVTGTGSSATGDEVKQQQNKKKRR